VDLVTLANIYIGFPALYAMSSLDSTCSDRLPDLSLMVTLALASLLCIRSTSGAANKELQQCQQYSQQAGRADNILACTRRSMSTLRP
jgi:hypothetical protein